MYIKKDWFIVNNEFLDSIESGDDYVAYWKDTYNALQEQWEDLTTSGIVAAIFLKFWWLIDPKKPISKRQMGLILSLIEKKAQRNILTLSKYEKFATTTRLYLLWLMNKAGQFELDRYLWKGTLKFELTHRILKASTTNRATELISWLDKYTVKKFSSELAKNLFSGKSKKETIENLTKVWNKLSEIRSQRVLKNETVASIEYMRSEVARMNWVEYKTWWAVVDERTCPVCKPLNWKTVRVGTNFPWWADIPPVHMTCRCTLEYRYDLNAIDNLYKAKYTFYSPPKDIDYPKYTNPNLVWAWGENFVGSDSKFFDYYYELSQYSKDQITRALDSLETSSWSNTILNPEKIILSARQELSLVGYVQLIANVLAGEKGRPRKINIKF